MAMAPSALALLALTTVLATVLALPTTVVVNPNLINLKFDFTQTFKTLDKALLQAQLVVNNTDAAWTAYTKDSKVTALFPTLRTLSTTENARRFTIFKANAAEVLKINLVKNQEWFAGLGPYSHLDWSEFSALTRAIPEPDNTLAPPTARDWPGLKEPTTGVDLRPATGKFMIDISGKGTQQIFTGINTGILDGLNNNINLNPIGRKLKALRGMEGARRGRELQQAPTSSKIDWTSKAGPVRNQGQCGSCWAFAAVGAIEALYRITGKNSNPDFSEEQIVDCCDIWRFYWSWACDGGYTSEALRYAKNNGLAAESKYPYKVSDSDSCNSWSWTSGAARAGSGDAIRDYGKVSSNNYVHLANSVRVNPTTISFRVVDSFRWYSGGVYSSSGCGGSTNHAMLVVGYDTTASVPYWKIKNSWGTGWGESGYIRVKMIKSTSSSGMCGMYSNAHRPWL